MNQAAERIQARRQSVRYNGDTLYCGVHRDPPDCKDPRALEPVVVIDASLDGLGLVVPFELTQEANIMIDLAGSNRQVRHLWVRVCNVQKVSSDLYRVGVSFDWHRQNSNLSRDLYWSICKQLRENNQSRALW